MFAKFSFLQCIFVSDYSSLRVHLINCSNNVRTLVCW